MNFWFVNQGRSFKEELEGNFIYAPQKNEKGFSCDHWSNVENVKKGDIIFCNKKGFIKAIGIAKSNGYESVIPASLEGKWNQIGFKVDIEYHELSESFHYIDYKSKYMSKIDLDKNPFTKARIAKMGYLYPMEEHIAEFFFKKLTIKKLMKLLKYTEMKHQIK